MAALEQTLAELQAGKTSALRPHELAGAGGSSPIASRIAAVPRGARGRLPRPASSSPGARRGSGRRARSPPRRVRHRPGDRRSASRPSCARTYGPVARIARRTPRGCDAGAHRRTGRGGTPPPPGDRRFARRAPRRLLRSRRRPAPADPRPPPCRRASAAWRRWRCRPCQLRARLGGGPGAVTLNFPIRICIRTYATGRPAASIANLLRGSDREFFDLFEQAGRTSCARPSYWTRCSRATRRARTWPPRSGPASTRAITSPTT